MRRTLAFAGGTLACILPLAALLIAPPAFAAGTSPICKGLKANAAKIAAANKNVQESTVHTYTYSSMTPQWCSRAKVILPALLDDKRIIDLDPQKCGVSDALIQRIDDDITNLRHSSEGCGT
jgi:hypothetical protein